MKPDTMPTEWATKLQSIFTFPCRVRYSLYVNKDGEQSIVMLQENAANTNKKIGNIRFRDVKSYCLDGGAYAPLEVADCEDVEQVWNILQQLTSKWIREATT